MMSVWVTPLGIFVALWARSGPSPRFDPVPPNTAPRKILITFFAYSCSAPGREVWGESCGAGSFPGLRKKGLTINDVIQCLV